MKCGVFILFLALLRLSRFELLRFVSLVLMNYTGLVVLLFVTFSLNKHDVYEFLSSYAVVILLL